MLFYFTQYTVSISLCQFFSITCLEYVEKNKQYPNGLEGNADSGSKEDETEDTDGVEVEHLHISDYQGFALISY